MSTHLELLCIAGAVSFAALSCGPPPKSGLTQKTAPKQSYPATTKITAFAVSNETLNVDKIGMREGSVVPDGNRDLAFTATLEGPLDALYLANTDEKGVAVHGFRADTVPGSEELPPEVGNVVDIGRLTSWIAVVEDGKFINFEGGAIPMLTSGTHTVKLYVPNTGTLQAGMHLRLFARGPATGVVGGPVINY